MNILRHIPRNSAMESWRGVIWLPGIIGHDETTKRLLLNETGDAQYISVWNVLGRTSLSKQKGYH
jgi:hypothetical protein